MKEHLLNNNDFILDEIESIELVGELETIDIEVADTHLFFANGIYTHNSTEDQIVISSNGIAESYKKVMIADFVLSISRRGKDKNDLKSSTDCTYFLIKNRFGADGIAFKGVIDLSIGYMSISDEKIDIEEEEKKNLQNRIKKKHSDHNSEKGHREQQ